jgi:hypothetical protein
MAIVARYHGLVADVVGHVVEINIAASRTAGGGERRNIGSLHESVASFRAPKLGRYLDDRDALGIGSIVTSKTNRFACNARLCLTYHVSRCLRRNA